MKLFFCLVFIVLTFLSPQPIYAAINNSFVNIVSPVRGNDFWDLKNQKPQDAVLGQLEILRQNNLQATFLLRFDALGDESILQPLKNSADEKGLFLEVTPTLTNAAAVIYHQSPSWHNAASILITGYSVDDRKKIIDTVFEGFKQKFGNYPKSVGAWWIDANSLSYMQTRYGVTNAMIVADQYSTDSYQIWGQYWGTPFYPAKNNALFPAQTVDNKIPVVITQWAARDPVNGYGTGVEESTYSVQTNDYLDYHNLDINYFSKLIDIYTKPETTQNQFGQIVVGLENSYSWTKYKNEYQNQINELVKKRIAGQFQIMTLDNFANWYKSRFPNLSPDQLIIAKDPLGGPKQVVWFMNNFYRVGWVANSEGSVIRDLRQYVSGQNEICLEKACNEVNFATFATRVLDEVTYGQKKIIDEGKIYNLKVNRQNDKVILTYQNEANINRDLEFLPRDISIDGKPSSIDGFILDSIQSSNSTQKRSIFNGDTSIKFSVIKQLIEFLLFSVFIIIAVLIPGIVIMKKVIPIQEKVSTLFLSTIVGLVNLTLIGFFSHLLFKNYWLIPIWIILNIGVFIYFKLYRLNTHFNINFNSIFLSLLIILGTIFITIPTFRNGLDYGYGIGFWGPNGHDGVWHLALINQMAKGVPPQNPILAGTQLQNYHYFFDLLVSFTSVWTKIPAPDLLFREFPILFSLLLGFATLTLLNFLGEKKNILTSGLSLYFVYTAGSFGWIVELVKNQGWNGESDFWANQAISFNLNPPFIISLLIMVAFIEILFIYLKQPKKLIYFLLIVLAGSISEFKAYGAILIGLSLLIGSLILGWRKNFSLFPVILGMGFLTILLLLPNYPSLVAIFQTGSGVFEFSPFWFIHSMVDSPDRLGLTRLTLTRLNGYETGNFLKIIYAESLGLLLFLLGNLGIRSFGLVVFFQKTLWKQFNYLFLFLFSFFSILIPLLFIQKGTPWNSIQFFYYFLFFSAIFTAITLGNLSIKLPQLVRPILLFAIIILTPVNCLAVAQGYLYPKPHAFISQGEEEGLGVLARKSTGIVLTYPYDKNLKKNLEQPLPLLAYETTSYVSAYSNKPTFEEDAIQQQILNFAPQPEYLKRIALTKNFFSGLQQKDAMAFLYSNKIEYIYLPKIYGIHLDNQNPGLINIFENNEIKIYKVTGYD